MRNVAVISLSAMLACAAFAQTENKAAGHWQGKIQIPEHELEVTVDLDRNAAGAWIGSMTLGGTTAVDVPLTTVTVDGSVVRFTANPGGAASFTGKISEDGKTLSGTASNGQGEAPFQLSRAGDPKVKVPPPSSALTKEFEGDWEGTLSVNGAPLRIGLKLSAAADGKAVATLTSYDQGNAEFRADSVTIQGKDFQFEIRGISGTYKGALGAGGEIAGEWAQGPGRFPLTFRRVAGAGKPGGR